MRAVVIVGLLALCQMALGRWVASPWFMPDLTLTGIVLAVILVPGRPLGPACLGGLAVLLLSVQHPVAMGGMLLGVGVLVKGAAGQWDLTAPSLQRVAVACAQGTFLAAQIALGASLTRDLLVLAISHLLITTLCVPLVRSLLISWVSLEYRR